MKNYNTQLQSNNTDLQTILNSINELPEASSGGAQATPIISVNTSGLITATAGVKSSTYQLAFQPATTIIPSATSQIAVPSYYYTGGFIRVAGDANLAAENIKRGVSIFGVSGALGAEGLGEYSINEDDIITRAVTRYFNDRVTTIGYGAFDKCYSLTTVSFPAVTDIGGHAFFDCRNLTTVSFPAATAIHHSAFQWCRNLTTVSFPAVTTIGNDAFDDCNSLTTVSFPAATTIGVYAFQWCYSLTTVSFPACTNIGMCAFEGCYNLKSLYLTGSSVCKLSYSDAFTSTPIGGYSAYVGTYGSIYVPASLLTSYQTATNWTYFSSRFVAFDGGDAGGSDNIITFTINGTSYQAEDGMTWAEWCDSEYNTIGAVVWQMNEFTTTINIGSGNLYAEDGSLVDISDIIVLNGIYGDYEYID